MIASWCPSEAAPPGSPCPACSFEGLSLTYLHTYCSWPRAHPRGARAQTPGLALLPGGALGRIPAPIHYRVAKGGGAV